MATARRRHGLEDEPSKAGRPVLPARAPAPDKTPSGESRRTPRRGTAGLYIPGSERLCDALDNLPGKLNRYGDHARYLLHCVSVKRWLGRLDDFGWARLHTEHLRHYIPPRVFHPLKRHLIREGILQTRGHSAGRKATGYRIAPAFDGPPVRVEIHNAALVAKLGAWRTAYAKPGADGVKTVVEGRRDILDAMLATLDRLDVAKAPEAIARELQNGQADHARYIASAIRHRDHDGLVVDPFGYRVHSIVTRTASAVRPYLRLDGQELTELDVTNAQPLLLAAALYLVRPRAQHIGGAKLPPPPAVSASAVPAAAVKLFQEADGEIASFRELCEAGALYEFMQDAADLPTREEAKHRLYSEVFFCRPNVNGKMTRAFAATWPTIHAGLQAMKHDQGYKSVARMLQRMESTIIIDGVCRRLVDEHPEQPFVTIHDAALVVSGHADDVADLMVDEFARHGVRATIRATRLTTGEGNQ